MEENIEKRKIFMGMSNYQELENRALEKVDNGNWDEAFEELKRLEMEENKDAMAVLAQFYLYGIGIATDVEYGIDMLEKAIRMGSGDAALTLGRIYAENDIGISIDIKKSFSYMEKGYELGNAECAGVLSAAYIQGNGVMADEKKAFQYAQIAVKAGVSFAMCNLAICYDDGLGTQRDASAAAYWYREYLNYEPDNDFAMLRLALCLSDPYEIYGIRPTGDMLNEAFYYVGKAVEKGNVEAHLIAGWFYERGEVVNTDFDLAHKYVQLAADNGNELAIEHLKVFRKTVYGTYYIPN